MLGRCCSLYERDAPGLQGHVDLSLKSTAVDILFSLSSVHPAGFAGLCETLSNAQVQGCTTVYPLHRFVSQFFRGSYPSLDSLGMLTYLGISFKTYFFPLLVVVRVSFPLLLLLPYTTG